MMDRLAPGWWEHSMGRRSCEIVARGDSSSSSGGQRGGRSSRRLRTPDPADRQVVATLVVDAAAGDRDAWNALVDTFAPTVWAVARGHRLGASDATAVFRTTWLRLLEHLELIEQPAKIGLWLAMTARRESLRLAGLTGRQVTRGDPVPGTRASSGATSDPIEEERRRIVNELVSQLPVRSQILLRLLSVDSPLSYLDISEALSMPIGSIGPTRARALDQLRRLTLDSGLELEDVFTLHPDTIPIVDPGAE